MIFLTIVILSAVITASTDLSSYSALDVSLVNSGQVWRLFTGHLTHLTWRHYSVDAPVFLMAYMVYRKNTGGLGSFYLLILSAIIVSAAVVFAGTHQIYGGLSGLSCAAISAIVFKIILDSPRRIPPYILMFAFLFYLLFMQGNASGINVAKEAHLAGTLTGVTYELIRRSMIKSNFRTPFEKADI